MKLEDVFDLQGQDGQENKAAFERLPKVLQYFITSQQNLLVTKVRKAVENKYGSEGLRDLIKTSGFRSHSVNARHNGIADSLHLWGCASDFRKHGIFKNNPIPVCCNLQVIDSGDCWHVQYRRG